MRMRKLTLTALLYSGSSFSGSLATLFSPMGSEYNLGSKFPHSEVTLNSITQYQTLMEEMRGEFPAGNSDQHYTKGPEYDV